LTLEADRDLQTYFNVINASLQEKRDPIQLQTDQMRGVLASGPLTRKKAKQVREDDQSKTVPKLDGGPEENIGAIDAVVDPVSPVEVEKPKASQPASISQDGQ